MEWFWYFVLYSFSGFALEWGFAKVRHNRDDRKCLLILPLCPVYGLGACAGLVLAPLAGGNPAALFFLGGAACTVVEYAVAVWYERWAGVSFWNYAGCPGNWKGRICLPFSAAWGILFTAGFYALHPAVSRFAAGIPAPVTAVTAFAVLADMAASHILLRRTGDRACLRWHNGFLSPGAEQTIRE